jgi:phenylpropionate dioxygenase-like ring-hydroxylating dioxygenase large terminal subunit
MLSVEDNETLCNVAPGTPMGELMRLYWIPALMSDELSGPDCRPLRLRLLSENLIAFRSTSGRAGIVANHCPHRGASLYFGRNEEDGLRCVYHGWKFDVTGTCVDMPNEPAESNFKDKVRAVAYPCQERNGIVWTYMGKEPMPPVPHLEVNMLSPDRYELSVQTTLRECNYMQALEGDIDTVHSNFLHDGAVRLEDLQPGTNDYYRRATLAPSFFVSDTDFGATYGASTPAEPDSTYWRIANFLFPFYTQIPSGVLGAQIFARAWVPIDEQNTMAWTIRALPLDADGNHPAVYRSQMREQQAQILANKPGHGYLPNSTDWLGRWRLGANAQNDYMIDREAQQQKLSYTGIPTIFLQDQAVTESMGSIYQRQNEHLGTADSMIIRARQRLIRAAEAYRDRGEIPPGVRNPEIYATRSGWTVLPNGVDWLEGTRELRRAFVERSPEELAANAPRPASKPSS